jgi:hypothetical protein
MPPTPTPNNPAPGLFTRRSALLIGVALATIAAGYAILVAGSASAAAVFLVLGYVVLVPLALLA